MRVQASVLDIPAGVDRNCRVSGAGVCGEKMGPFFSAVPIAVAVNVVRLTVTAAMAVWISPETAHGFLHDISGLIIFGAALVLVYLVFIVELKLEKKQTG